MREAQAVHAPVRKTGKTTASRPDVDALTPGLKAMLDAFEGYVKFLDEHVKARDTKYYRGYWTRQRFAVIQAWKSQLTLYLLLDRAVGDKLLAAGSLADIARYNPQNEMVVVLQSMEDLEMVKPAIAMTYNAKAARS